MEENQTNLPLIISEDIKLEPMEPEVEHYIPVMGQEENIEERDPLAMDIKMEEDLNTCPDVPSILSQEKVTSQIVYTNDTSLNVAASNPSSSYRIPEMQIYNNSPSQYISVNTGLTGQGINNQSSSQSNMNLSEIVVTPIYDISSLQQIPAVQNENMGQQIQFIQSPNFIVSPPSTPQYQCTICNQYFSNLLDLNKHISTHNPYKCIMCSYSFEKLDQFQVRNHMKLVHNVLIREVTDSNESNVQQRLDSIPINNSTPSLQNQNSNLLTKNALICEYCEKQPFKTVETKKPFLTFDHLQSHYINCHFSIIKKFYCKQCDIKYRCPYELQEHNNIKHSCNVSFDCNFCGLNYQMFSEYKIHAEKHTENSNKFKCKICKSMFLDKKSWELHYFPYKCGPKNCPICYERFYKKEALDDHMKIHDRDFENVMKKSKFGVNKFGPESSTDESSQSLNAQSYLCSICDKTFTSCSDLKTHLYIIHMLNPLTSELYSLADTPVVPAKQKKSPNCKKVSKKRKNGIPYECDVCNRKYITPSQFKRHIGSHTKFVAFNCPVCSRGFKYEHDMKKHLSRSHEKVTPQQVPNKTMYNKSVYTPASSVPASWGQQEGLVASPLPDIVMKNPQILKFYTQSPQPSVSRNAAQDEPTTSFSESTANVDAVLPMETVFIKEESDNDVLPPENVCDNVQQKLITSNLPDNNCASSSSHQNSDMLGNNNLSIQNVAICEFCSKIFKTFEELAFHKVNFHMPIINSNLPKQIVKNVPVAINYCEICKKPFKSIEQLAYHKVQCIVPKIYNMPIPNKPIPVTYDRPRINNSLPNQNVVINCEFCSESFKSFEQLVFHKVQFHLPKNNRDLPKQNLSICEFCSESFKSFEQLAFHKVHSHLAKNNRDLPKQNESICEFCSESFKSFEQLAFHKVHTHFSIINNFYCETCKLQYKCPYVLQDHNNSKHSTNVPFECHICGVNYQIFEQYKRHAEKHSGNNTSFECKLCNSMFLDKKTWDLHVFGNKNRQINCEICEQKFFIKESFDIHMKIHDNDFENLMKKSNDSDESTQSLNVQSYLCSICDKTFTSSSDLKIHLYKFHKLNPLTSELYSLADTPAVMEDQDNSSNDTIDSEDKVFKKNPNVCEFCNKSFKHPCLVKRHAVIHSDLKPFVCPVCDKSFKVKGNLTKHLLNSHPLLDSPSSPPDVPVKNQQDLNTQLPPAKPAVSRDVRAAVNEPRSTFSESTLKVAPVETIVIEEDSDSEILPHETEISSSNDPSISKDVEMCDLVSSDDDEFVLTNSPSDDINLKSNDTCNVVANKQNENLIPIIDHKNNDTIESKKSKKKEIQNIPSQSFYKCKFCPTICKDVDEFKFHIGQKDERSVKKFLIKSKTRNKKFFYFTCPTCRGSFEDSDAYNSHVLRHKKKKKYQCLQCKKKFLYLCDFKRHKLQSSACQLFKRI